MNKVSLTIICISLLVISSSFIFNTVPATSPATQYTEIVMEQNEINRTLIVIGIKITQSGGGPVEFKGNASYPLPPLEIGNKITNCTGIIMAIQPDDNRLVGRWEFQGDTDSNITSYSYTFINPNSESNKTPGFELILVLIAVVFVLFWQRKRI